MLRLPFILYLLLFFSTIKISAQQQNFIFQHITTKDGLASDISNFIFQDSKGFYWIGYNNGFQKFDGKNFSTIPFKDKYVSKTLSDQPVISPLEDKDGNVYIPNQTNIYVYHSSGKADTIKIFDYLNDSANDIISLCKDERDNVCIVASIKV